MLGADPVGKTSGVRGLFPLFALMWLFFAPSLFGAEASARPLGAAEASLAWVRLDAKGGSEAIPGGLPFTLKDSATGGLEVEASFTLPQDWIGPVGLILYKNDMAITVYVNGRYYVDAFGRQGSDFFFEPYITRGVLINSSFLKPGLNTVRLAAYNDNGIYSFRKVSLVDEVGYRASMSTYSFLDIQLPRLCCALLLFVALYSMFSFVNYREKKESLFLALSAFFFAAYLLNVTMETSPLRYIPLKACLYSCFPVSLIFLIQFFNSFLHMNAKPLILKASVAIGLVFTVGYYFQRSTAALNAWHSAQLLFPAATLVFGFVGAIRGLKGKKAENLVLLAGLVVAVLFSCYDVYYFIGNKPPVVLLQGVGFMTLIIATFYCFSQDIANANRKVVRYSIEMEQSKRVRDELFARIRSTIEKSEASGSILNQSIDQVGALVSQYIANVEVINESIQTQNAQISSNKGTVDSIFESINRTSAMIDEHSRLVGTTADSIARLTDQVHATDQLVKKSGETIKRLTEVCLAADSEVGESTKEVDDLAGYSKHINSIVSSIGDIAEKTNVLSINAAIEAARSGASGKGFAVVASEIRALATRSSESANQINEILRPMVEKIDLIQERQFGVSKILKEIVAENGDIDKAMTEVFACIGKQLEASGQIGETLADLVETVKRISEQAKRQEASGIGLKGSMETLGALCAAVIVSLKEQKGCNEELKDNLHKLQSVSAENFAVVSDLNALVVAD
jgi:methyl-accepting chemotaxis protein